MAQRGRPPKEEHALSKTADHRKSLKPIDFFAISNMDPERSYRFVSKVYLDKCGGFDRRGWEPITSQNSKGEQLMSQWGTVSAGTDLRMDDLVLCFMPKERAEMKKAALQRQQDMMRSTLQRFKRSATAMGMEPDIDVTIQRQGRTEAVV